jgi:diacylglycerol kinase family enzyme
MNHEKKLGVFTEAVSVICSRSRAAPEQALRWAVIANPTAGGFTISAYWKGHERALADAAARSRDNPARDAKPAACSLAGGGVLLTDGPSHAGEIARALIEEARSSRDFYLIVIAGGDGTSLEVLQALFEAHEEVRSRCAVARLPMGTGNDGADAPDLAGALDLLILPSVREMARGIRLTTAAGASRPGGKPFLAFNILSVGLDAFVTHMTNKMKGKLPGDSYKLWVDVASLLYDKMYTVAPLRVTAYDGDGKQTADFTKKLLLCAVGASGHRTYGSRKKILPDERNVCAVQQMPLLRKLAIKGLFTTGGHVDRPESLLFNAARVVISGEYPMLAQMDGETVLLRREDFPAVIELTAPVIPVLKARQARDAAGTSTGQL